jgi:inner membrane protein YhjD
MVAVPESIKRLAQRPVIAHMIRAVERYLSRLGTQFAAATSYFSVLALVPILMVAFSITGFVLTIVQPGLLDDVAAAVANFLSATDPATREKIVGVVNNALSSFWTIGVIGLVAALYTGAVWMGHLKNAVRTQWRPGFDLRPEKINIVIKTLGNLLLLLGLLVGMAVMFGLSSLSTSLANTVVAWLGLSDQPWIAPLLRVSSIVISIGTGWLIFMYLYTVLPETREPWSVVRRGALLGSIALVALQFVASALISAFRGNPAAVHGSLLQNTKLCRPSRRLKRREKKAKKCLHRRRNLRNPSMRNRMWYRRRWLRVRYALAWALVMSPEPQPEWGSVPHSRTRCQPYGTARDPDRVSAKRRVEGWADRCCPVRPRTKVPQCRTACPPGSCRTRWRAVHRRVPHRAPPSQTHRGAQHPRRSRSSI